MTLRPTAAHDLTPERSATDRHPVQDDAPTIAAIHAGTPDDPVVREVDYDHPDAVTLVSALFADQSARYGYADPIEADPADYRPPDGAFLVAYVQGRPVACGGYRTYRPSAAAQDAPGTDAEDSVGQTIEIKKMYTVPEHRGHGYGRQLLAELERRATDAGAQQAILETGVRNRSALTLYTGAGYRPAASYVPGRDPAINRAFTKPLGPADPEP